MGIIVAIVVSCITGTCYQIVIVIIVAVSCNGYVRIVAIVVSCITGTCYQIVSCQLSSSEYVLSDRYVLLLSSSAVLQVRVIRSLAVRMGIIVAIVVSCITGTCYQIVSCQNGYYCCYRRQLYYRYVLSDR